jgi:Flp pilus assembly protein TadD
MQQSLMRVIHNKAVMGLLLAVVTFAVYWQVGSHQFVNYDDGKYILENPHIRKGLTGENVIWAFTSTYASNWHPLTWLSHMLDVQLFGLNPGPHHLVNVLIHAVNTVLLFLLLLRLTGSYWQSVFVAALFALHPLHVESVAWAAERKDVLSAFFFMVTLLLYARYVELPVRGRYLATLGAFAIGLMAKPMLVTVPFVFLLLDYWPLGRFRNELIGVAPNGTQAKTFQWPAMNIFWEKIPFIVLAAASSIITLYAQNKGGAISSVKALSLSFRVIDALWAYILYLAKTIVPVNLAVFYPLPTVRTISEGLVAAAILGAITCLVIWQSKRHPSLLVGWLWYLGMLVPVIGLVQVGSQSMADRYSYLPLIGIFIMLAWGMRIAAGNNRVRRAVLSVVAIVLLMACMVITWFQIGYWKNSITLFGHATESVSGNYVAHEALGLVFAKRGRYDEAVAQYAESLRIWPEYDRALIGMGNVLARQGKLDEAAFYADRAMRLQPDMSDAHFLMGFVLMKQGRLNEALSHYFAGLRTDPENAGIHEIIGVILGSEGKLDESIAQFTEALQIKPNDANMHYGLGLALLRMGKIDESIMQFTEALRLKPDFEKARLHLDKALRMKNESR